MTPLPPANGGSLNCTVQMVWFPSFSQIGLNSGGGGGFRVEGSTGCPAKSSCGTKRQISPPRTRARLIRIRFTSVLLILVVKFAATLYQMHKWLNAKQVTD